MRKSSGSRLGVVIYSPLLLLYLPSNILCRPNTIRFYHSRPSSHDHCHSCSSIPFKMAAITGHIQWWGLKFQPFQGFKGKVLPCWALKDLWATTASQGTSGQKATTNFIAYVSINNKKIETKLMVRPGLANTF